MDCEKLDEIAIDLIDASAPGVEGEGLDARRVQEAEEHLASCERCAAMIERLRGGARAARELPLEEPSSFLEARILAAASTAKPPPSWTRRTTRAIATVGSWAMRPQIAMAAVLIVMVGTSVMLLRGGGLPSARRTKVLDEGAPVATLEPQLPEQSGAPGVIGGKKAEPAPTPAKNEAADKTATKGGEAFDDEKKPAADEAAKSAKEKSKLDGDGLAANEQQAPAAAPKAISGAPAAPPPPAAAGGFAGPAPAEVVEGKKDLAEAPAKKSAAPGAAPTTTTTDAPASYDDAMTAYKEARWADAAKGFEASANAGSKPSTSWLYAGRSFRASGSCVQAIPRFRKVLDGYPASSEVPYAALEGGQCARAIGDVATARTLLEKAKTYPATEKQATAELAALSAPPATAPAKAKAAKPPSATDSAY